MNVLARARLETCRRLSLARKPIEYKGLQRTPVEWPGACFDLGRAGVAAPGQDLWLIP
jgi:hypothetical protein